jgi:hypothetical protein
MSSDEELPQLVRFSDLQARGIAPTYQGVRHMQKHFGFPLGRLLGPSTRVWTAKEVNEWLASRPTEQSRQTRGRAARSVEARRQQTAREIDQQQKDGRAA